MSFSSIPGSPVSAVGFPLTAGPWGTLPYLVPGKSGSDGDVRIIRVETPDAWGIDHTARRVQQLDRDERPFSLPYELVVIRFLDGSTSLDFYDPDGQGGFRRRSQSFGPGESCMIPRDHLMAVAEVTPPFSTFELFGQRRIPGNEWFILDEGRLVHPDDFDPEWEVNFRRVNPHLRAILP